MADYEEIRRKKLEDNKKKLEQLNLGHLCAALRASTTPKPSPSKQVKRKAPQEEFVICRRSNRIANLPEQSYKDVIPEVIKRPSRAYKQRRDLSGRVYASDEARGYAQTKAEELESELGAKFPSFVKAMLQSHTTGGFWLGLPTQFCNKHLPKMDTWITLVDENEDESETNYLAQKRGLSAGWRGFSIAHELVDGDALVFELVKPTRFKVFIIRQSDYSSS